jgi:hypothetical protein
MHGHTEITSTYSGYPNDYSQTFDAGLTKMVPGQGTPT